MHLLHLDKNILVIIKIKRVRQNNQSVYLFRHPNFSATSVFDKSCVLFWLVVNWISVPSWIMVVCSSDLFQRFSFDLSYKTAEDVNIPLSSPMLSGGFELKPGIVYTIIQCLPVFQKFISSIGLPFFRYHIR